MTLPESAQLLEQCITRAGQLFCWAVKEKRMADAFGLDELKKDLLKLRTPETIRLMEISIGLT